MPRGPGRDRGVALQRLVRILTVLAQAAPGWVNRDRLLDELDYGAGPIASHRDALARDLRHLRDLGWGIESADQGEDMRHRLVDRDPRLHTMLTTGEIHQLSRAVVLSGRNPGDLGLPGASTRMPPAPLQLGTLRLELEEILHALHHRCLLTIGYRGSDRDVSVDEVRRTETGRWLIVGREGGSDEQRAYRIDRIQHLRVGSPGSAGPRLAVTKDPDPLTFVDGEPVTAIVRTVPEHEARVVRDLGRPSSRRVVDGEVELAIPVVNRWLWRMRLYQLDTRVRLVGPESLRTEVRDELSAFTAVVG